MGLDESRIRFVEDRKGHDFRYALDDAKIKALGFRESIEFEAGVIEAIKWYESNQKWWGKLLTPLPRDVGHE